MGGVHDAIGKKKRLLQADYGQPVFY